MAHGIGVFGDGSGVVGVYHHSQFAGGEGGGDTYGDIAKQFCQFAGGGVVGVRRQHTRIGVKAGLRVGDLHDVVSEFGKVTAHAGAFARDSARVQHLDIGGVLGFWLLGFCGGCAGAVLGAFGAGGFRALLDRLEQLLEEPVDLFGVYGDHGWG